MRGQVLNGAFPPQDLETSDLPGHARRSLDDLAPVHDRRADAVVGEDEDVDGVVDPGDPAVLGLGQQRELAAVADSHRAREARLQSRHQVDLVPFGQRREEGRTSGLVDSPVDGDGQGVHVIGLQPRLRERLGDEPVQNRESGRRVEIGLHGPGALGQRRS